MVRDRMPREGAVPSPVILGNVRRDESVEEREEVHR
jgi:hypothetical protein